MEISVLLRNDDADHAVVGNLGYVMVALLGGVFVIKGSIEVGDIQSFFQYIRNFTQPNPADRSGYKTFCSLQLQHPSVCLNS